MVRLAAMIELSMLQLYARRSDAYDQWIKYVKNELLMSLPK